MIKSMTAQEWLTKAKNEHFALGAFNVGNLETLKAIVQAAVGKNSPVIIETSPGETAWMTAANLVDLAQNYSQEFNIPILINLDHAKTLEDCLKAIEAGYHLVHFDGSELPFEENLKIAKKVVEIAHNKGILVEGEFDHIAGSSEVHSGSAQTEIADIPMTDPEKAKKFVEESGVDILAAFFGNVHGVFKEGGEDLDIGQLIKIAQVVNCFLSLHGGSGIPDNQVEEVIQNGIVKVNINTEIRLAFKESLEKSLHDYPNEYAPYKFEKPVVESVQKIVEQKIVIFGSANVL